MVMELTKFVLTNNYFEAEECILKWGLAVGTLLAISAAVVYMASLVEPLLRAKVLHLFFIEGSLMTLFFCLEWKST